jgi:hypothetical protein
MFEMFNQNDNILDNYKMSVSPKLFLDLTPLNPPGGTFAYFGFRNFDFGLIFSGNSSNPQSTIRNYS